VQAPLADSSSPQPVQGSEKAAALLLAMGKPAAAQLLKHFDEAELKLVTRAAAKLGPIPIADMEALVEEFASQFSVGPDVRGTPREVENLITGVLPPEQVSQLMSDLAGKPAGSVWEKVDAAPENSLKSLIEKEHPQIAAIILSKVNSACAATVLGRLPQDLRNQVMRRMLSARPVPDVAQSILDSALPEDLFGHASGAAGETQARVANVMNKMERDLTDEMLRSLEETRPAEAKALKGLLFSFAEIVKLAPKARMVLFDQIPAEKIVLALSGTDAEFREVVLSSLASRARRMAEAELNEREEAPPREVAEAQRAIANAALDLASRGEIELPVHEANALDAA
jgi:flagellar motor switch protein FliG